mmetsp:Transcript_94226/g.236457  ORF Transcript_94226/g.236457 Transcript_94226/m.236457 type:complete len:246 (-) Transcript_94226:690-1427(-)
MKNVTTVVALLKSMHRTSPTNTLARVPYLFRRCCAARAKEGLMSMATPLHGNSPRIASMMFPLPQPTSYTQSAGPRSHARTRFWSPVSEISMYGHTEPPASGTYSSSNLLGPMLRARCCTLPQAAAAVAGRISGVRQLGARNGRRREVLRRSAGDANSLRRFLVSTVNVLPAMPASLMVASMPPSRLRSERFGTSMKMSNTSGGRPSRDEAAAKSARRDSSGPKLRTARSPDGRQNSTSTRFGSA